MLLVLFLFYLFITLKFMYLNLPLCLSELICWHLHFPVVLDKLTITNQW